MIVYSKYKCTMLTLEADVSAHAVSFLKPIVREDPEIIQHLSPETQCHIRKFISVNTNENSMNKFCEATKDVPYCGDILMEDILWKCKCIINSLSCSNNWFNKM